MKKSTLIVLLPLLFLVLAKADPAQDTFRKANQAYSKNDYQAAVDSYEQLLQSGYRSAELEFNLGNAYYRLGNLGMAVLHLERCLMIAPRMAEARENLQIVNKGLSDEIEPLPPFFLTHLWENARMWLPAGVWGTLAIGIWWLGFAALGMWLLGKNRTQKKWGFIGGVCCILLSLLPFSLALSRAFFQQNSRQAIVTEKTTALRSSPDEAGTEIRALHEGTKVEMIESLSGWWRIKLANGEQGWLEGKVMEQI